MSHWRYHSFVIGDWAVVFWAASFMADLSSDLLSPCLKRWVVQFLWSMFQHVLPMPSIRAIFRWVIRRPKSPRLVLRESFWRLLTCKNLPMSRFFSPVSYEKPSSGGMNPHESQSFCLVGGLEHDFYDFPFSWEWKIIPTDFPHIFRRGRSTTNQIIYPLVI